MVQKLEQMSTYVRKLSLARVLFYHFEILSTEFVHVVDLRWVVKGGILQDSFA